MAMTRKNFVEVGIQAALLSKGMNVHVFYGTWFSGDGTFFPEDEDVSPEHIGIEAMAMTGSDVDGGFGLWPMEGKSLDKFFEKTEISPDEDEE